MPRLRNYRPTETHYYIRARSHGQIGFHLPNKVVWEILGSQLYYMTITAGVKIEACVLLNNEFHLLAQFPEGNLPTTMQYFLTSTSKAMGRAAGRINHSYGTRYFSSHIAQPMHRLSAYKYLLRLPVEAKHVENFYDYEFSTAHALLGKSIASFPVIDPWLMDSDLNEIVRWIDQAPHAHDFQTIRKALRRNQFQFPLTNNKRAHRLDLRLY